MIFKYEVINPVVSNKKPFYDFKRKLFLFPVDVSYKYYVECAVNDVTTGGREYFILLGNEKFDENCRKCKVDDYGRCQINVRGEIKDYIINEVKVRGNIEVEYSNNEDNYDVYHIL